MAMGRGDHCNLSFVLKGTLEQFYSGPGLAHSGPVRPTSHQITGSSYIATGVQM
jgi:hypothetical protein